MKSNQTIRRLTEGGIIAAMYAALSLFLAPMSFGPIQIRVAEMLCLLPAYTPAAIPGLAVGCAITNTVGMLMGVNVTGVLDIIGGTLATLLAALLSWWLRKVRIKDVPVLSALPPVLINAVVVSAELTYVFTSPFSWAVFGLYAGYIAIGQAVACGIGLLLCLGPFKKLETGEYISRR